MVAKHPALWACCEGVNSVKKEGAVRVLIQWKKMSVVSTAGWWNLHVSILVSFRAINGLSVCGRHSLDFTHCTTEFPIRIEQQWSWKMLPPFNCRYTILLVFIEEMFIDWTHKLFETSIFGYHNKSRLLLWRETQSSIDRCVLLLCHQVEQYLDQALGIQKWQSFEDRLVISCKNTFVDLNDCLNFSLKTVLASARTRVCHGCYTSCGSNSRFRLLMFWHGWT